MHWFCPMCPDIDVKFVRLPRDPSVEAAVQRWVDRIGWNIEVDRAVVSIERIGWRRLSVSLELFPSAGKLVTAATSHTDIYVAVADVFRAARKQLLRGVAAAPVAWPYAMSV
jgi:hypothetical protein